MSHRQLVCLSLRELRHTANLFMCKHESWPTETTCCLSGADIVSNFWQIDMNLIWLCKSHTLANNWQRPYPMRLSDGHTCICTSTQGIILS